MRLCSIKACCTTTPASATLCWTFSAAWRRITGWCACSSGWYTAGWTAASAAMSPATLKRFQRWYDMNPIRYMLDGYRWLVNPYGLLDRALARHGLTFRIRLPVLGDVLMTGDEKLIDEIVHHKDLDGGKAVSALRAIFGGRSLIMLEGEAHAARRRLIAPSFCGEGLAAY